MSYVRIIYLPLKKIDWQIIIHRRLFFFFQSQVWGNLEKLLECKKRCLENAQKSEREDTVIHREPGTETLVL